MLTRHGLSDRWEMGEMGRDVKREGVWKGYGKRLASVWHEARGSEGQISGCPVDNCPARLLGGASWKARGGRDFVLE